MKKEIYIKPCVSEVVVCLEGHIMADSWNSGEGTLPIIPGMPDDDAVYDPSAQDEKSDDAVTSGLELEW